MKKDVLAATIIALLLGLGGGYGLAQVIDDSKTESASEVAMDEHMHGDAKFEVPAESAPTVDFEVIEDAKSGWNVHIKTTNFTFAPNNVNGQNATGEGHAHLYVDGEKVARVYGEYFHYDENFDGSKTFKVTLNANDHSEYAVNGLAIHDENQISHDHTMTPHNDMHNQ